MCSTTTPKPCLASTGGCGPRGDYQRSLELLRRTRELTPWIYTKSGIMAGLGETDAEVQQVMADLRAVDCDILTIGQYCNPAPSIYRWWTLLPPSSLKLATTGRSQRLFAGCVFPADPQFLPCRSRPTVDGALSPCSPWTSDLRPSLRTCVSHYLDKGW
jgi:hypothetical protein